MSLSSVIKSARLLSVEDVRSILETALGQLSREAKENCNLYSEQDQQAAGCPGEASCSVEDVLLTIATATFEYFNVTVFDEFEDIKVYAIK